MKLLLYFWFGLLVSIFLIWAQTFRLQVLYGKEKLQIAEQNRFQIIPIKANRGLFYDRNGKALVEYKDNQRHFLYPEALAHILGYTGEANKDELVLFGVDLGSKVGKLGLEREENTFLQGMDGGQLVELSADQQPVRVISQVTPVAGKNIQLTLDADLQDFSYKLLEKSGYSGSIVVSSIDNQLLSLVSYPSFDANIFENKDKNDKIRALFTDKSMPMFFRAIGGMYPPASPFKIITAMAGLEEKVMDPSWQVEDTGVIKVGEFRYGNWYFDQYGKKEGMIDLAKGLARSNDIYFYKLGEKVGIEKLADWARIFGLGSKTGISINGEEAGLVPDTAWKKSNRDESWFLGDTYITAIGQGNLQTTPLQMHSMVVAVSNEGKLCKPQLKLGTLDQIPQTVDLKNTFVDCHDLPIHKENIEAVISGMQKACQPGGTGWPLFGFKVKEENFINTKLLDNENYIAEASGSAQWVKIPVACKTGTAETGRTIVKNKKLEHLTHAWFVAFAPVKNPQIVVTVMLEDAGQGSDKAGPLARDIFQWCFSKTHPSPPLSRSE